MYRYNDQGGVCLGCKFHGPWGGDSLAVACLCKLILYGENALILWNLILLSRAWSRQGECTGIMIREGSAWVVDFFTPRWGFFARALLCGCGMW